VGRREEGWVGGMNKNHKINKQTKAQENKNKNSRHTNDDA